MKIKELIEDLSKYNPELEVNIAVYDCSGYNDSFEIDGSEHMNGEGYDLVQLGINVACATHRKWTTQGNCPIDKLKEELKKVEEVQKTIDYYKLQMEQLEKRFSERSQK